jgi:hypothetical protein
MRTRFGLFSGVATSTETSRQNTGRSFRHFMGKFVEG